MQLEMARRSNLGWAFALSVGGAGLQCSLLLGDDRECRRLMIQPDPFSF